MKCENCKVEIEENDNFCFNCGQCTNKGIEYFKNENNISLINGDEIKQNNKLGYLLIVISIFGILFLLVTLIRGQDILKPVIYLKKQINNFKYGYNTSIMKTDNEYNNINIANIDEAKNIIINDFEKQIWQCKDNLEVGLIEKEIEETNDILSVCFCDVSIEKSQKLGEIINGVFELFPIAKGYLTNITVTNSKSNETYIAYFQPIYQFVNGRNNLKDYCKVNKTQILLNSYYYINDDILNNNSYDMYVKDASWESLLSHELGHYISFVALMKTYEVENIIYINEYNINDFNLIMSLLNQGSFSYSLVEEAIYNYNNKYETSISINDFSKSISLYAYQSISGNNKVPDEIIAEAVHDYYLHRENANKESLEIIKVLESKLVKK